MRRTLLWMTPTAGHVLLVEDDDDHAVLAKAALRGGAVGAVDRVRSCREASDRLRSCAYTALVVDFQLGDGDGLSVIADARASGVDTPALLLTSHGSEYVAARALRGQVDDYLPKEEGLRGDALARAVLAMVERRRVSEALARATAEAERLRGVLLAARTMEHYLGNQLTATLGFAELLVASGGLQGSALEFAAEAVEGVKRAMGTLRELQELGTANNLSTAAGVEVIDLAGDRD